MKKKVLISDAMHPSIIPTLAELGFEIEEKYFTPDDVKQADGAFFTGTAAEVTGIKSLDGVNFKYNWEDTMGYELSRKYLRRVAHNEYRDFSLV